MAAITGDGCKILMYSMRCYAKAICGTLESGLGIHGTFSWTAAEWQQGFQTDGSRVIPVQIHNRITTRMINVAGALSPI